MAYLEKNGKLEEEKSQKGLSGAIKGQLTIWDIKIMKGPSIITKAEHKTIPQNLSSNENNKCIIISELTEMQQKYIKDKSIMKDHNLSRIIKYHNGSIGIEIMEKLEFITIYINRIGKIEFKYNGKLPVLPIDNILYYRDETIMNGLQKKNLTTVMEKYKLNIKRMIHRLGDDNVLLELSGKTISLLPNGWVLEFSIFGINYKEDEILNMRIGVTDSLNKN